MKLLFTAFFALIISLLSLNATAQITSIDNGLTSIVFEGDKKAAEEEEEPDCD